MIQSADTKVEKVRRAAKALYADDDVEISEDAKVSWSSTGAWVEAWVYVDDEIIDHTGAKP